MSILTDLQHVYEGLAHYRQKGSTSYLRERQTEVYTLFPSLDDARIAKFEPQNTVSAQNMQWLRGRDPRPLMIDTHMVMDLSRRAVVQLELDARTISEQTEKLNEQRVTLQAQDRELRYLHRETQQQRAVLHQYEKLTTRQSRQLASLRKVSRAEHPGKFSVGRRKR